MNFQKPNRWNDKSRLDLLNSIMIYNNYTNFSQISQKDLIGYISSYNTKKFNYKLENMIDNLLQKPHDVKHSIVPIVTIPQTFKSTTTTPILHNLNFDILLIFALNLVVYLFVSQCLHCFISILAHLHQYLIVYFSFVNFVIFNKNKNLQNFVKNSYEFLRMVNFK